MIATGERPKKKNILEDLDLKRRALLLDSGEDLLDEEELGSGIDEGDDRYYFDEDDDDFDYDGEDIERDLGPRYDEFEDAEEPCPGLEPAGSATRVKYDRTFDDDLHASEDDADRGDDDAVAHQETAGRLDVEETTVYEDADEGVDDSEHYQTIAADIEVSAASEEPEDASVSRRQYEEMADAEVAESEGHLQREELCELQTPDSMQLEKELSPTIEVSPARDDTPEGGSESNLVEPLAAPAADGSGSGADDVNGDCRAKLTLMKSEAAQRLDDLEKLIDEHQEIVEELKRTESNQGSLADLASMSPAASPVPFPAITPTEQLESRTVETPDPYAEETAETPDPYAAETAETRDSHTEETAETPDPYAGETAEVPDPRLPGTTDRAEADEQPASESDAVTAALHHVAEPAEHTPEAAESPAILSDTAGESASADYPADEYEDPGDSALQ